MQRKPYPQEELLEQKWEIIGGKNTTSAD